MSENVTHGLDHYGCEFCGDFPARLVQACHPNAPLRAELLGPNELVLYCYVPPCGREVARFKIVEQRERPNDECDHAFEREWAKHSGYEAKETARSNWRKGWQRS